MTEIIPTRGAALALADERDLMKTGFEFLDEKRMMLAAALLNELKLWKSIRDDYAKNSTDALLTLKNATVRHGFDSLRLYPTASTDTPTLAIKTNNFLGIHLITDPDFTQPPPAPIAAVDASPQAEACRDRFAKLITLATKLAIHAANIEKLITEYRNTERRARALENVILPETIASLNAITEYLDEADQEEAIRNRNAAT